MAGGGGGAAYPTNEGTPTTNGRPGGVTFDGRATTADGSPGSSVGQGGARGSNLDDYTAGGGGGFVSPGLPRTAQSNSGVRYYLYKPSISIFVRGTDCISQQGGSNSYNYGGDFTGGQSYLGVSSCSSCQLSEI